jgi:hypothetical protein
VLVRGGDGTVRSRMGLALWATAEGAVLPAVPHGRWTISSTSALQLWIARDDRDPVADRGRPRRASRFWDAGYTRRDALGATLQGDDPGSAIHRTGTLSALATAAPGVASDGSVGSNIIAVGAVERWGSAAAIPAAYSGRRADGLPVPVQVLVDDGWPGCGVMAAANGGARRVRISGTSAAAGLYVRQMVMPGNWS